MEHCICIWPELSKNRTISGSKGYNKMAQQIQKWGKACAKHLRETSQAKQFGSKRESLP